MEYVERSGWVVARELSGTQSADALGLSQIPRCRRGLRAGWHSGSAESAHVITATWTHTRALAYVTAIPARGSAQRWGKCRWDVAASRCTEQAEGGWRTFDVSRGTTEVL